MSPQAPAPPQPTSISPVQPAPALVPARYLALASRYDLRPRHPVRTGGLPGEINPL